MVPKSLGNLEGRERGGVSSATQGGKGGSEVSDGVIRCYCSTIPTDLEFKQRQPEVERSQVTMSLKIGQGAYGEVNIWCKCCLATNCWYFLTLRLILPSSLSLLSSLSLSSLSCPSPSSSPTFPLPLLLPPSLPPSLSCPSPSSSPTFPLPLLLPPSLPPSLFSPPLPFFSSPPLQSWKGSWSGHTVVMKKLKTKGDVFKSGYMDSFPHEYLRLR